MTASQQLAHFISRTRYEDLPQQVIDTIKRLLLDTLAVAIAGAASAQGRAIHALLEENSGGAEATVVGTRLRAGRLQAAFANGVLIRALEMDETFEDTLLHVAPGTIGAALALIEHERCTGKVLLTALALGYEVSQRVARAVSPELATRGFHPTGTCGSFGATAAAAKIMKLGEGQIASALGITGLQAAGLLAGQAPEWRFLTSINGGNAAHLGVLAASLARHGFPGSPDIFESPDGFAAAHAGRCDTELITLTLGTEYVLCEAGFKLFPSSRFTHAGITAASLLRERYDLKARLIAEVTVRGFSTAIALSDKPLPASPLDAQGSQQFTVAVTLIKGTFSLNDLTAPVLQDPEVRELMAKVKVLVDPVLEAERQRDQTKWPTVVDVVMTDGTRYRQRTDHPLGAAQNPATGEQFARKFNALVRTALPQDRANELWKAVESLEELAHPEALRSLWEAPIA